MVNRASSENRLRKYEATIGGIPTPVVEAGPADEGDAIVFVHGNPGSTAEWERLVQQSGAFARAVVFDMPGFGRAGKPGDFEYSMRGYAEHLDAVFAHLGIERAHLVMHDFGGGFGLRWALEHPDRVASVSLVNTGILPGYRWHMFGRLWRLRVVGEVLQATTTRAFFRFSLGHGVPRGLPDTFLEESWRNYDRATRRVVLQLYRATPPSAIHELARNAIEHFAECDIPAMVIWGEHDPYLSWRFAETQREAFPSAQVRVLEDSGHWPHVDNPETTAGLLLPFLNQQCVRGRSTSAA